MYKITRKAAKARGLNRYYTRREAMKNLQETCRALRRRLERFVGRWRWLRDYEQSLNRRAEVEQELFDAARGKRSLPDAEQCRKWAIRLGVPDKWKGA